MRGKVERQAVMLTAIIQEALVPQKLSLGRTKPMSDRALAGMTATLDGMYAALAGHPFCRNTCWRKLPYGTQPTPMR